MNIRDFERAIFSIERGIELAHFKLNYDRNFPNKVRIEFNAALEELLKLLNDDERHLEAREPIWHTAYRIVELDKFYNKIDVIREKIFDHCDVPYFVTKIRSKVLPSLLRRVDELKSVIASKGRLPFSEGVERAQYHQEVKLNLQVETTNKIQAIEKEYFHFLGDQFDKRDIENINQHFYDANFEIYSLESWVEVLNSFIAELDPAERAIPQVLLSVIQKAIPLSLKTSFAFQIGQLCNHYDKELELNYFRDLVRSSMPASSSSRDALTPAHFLRRYELAKSCYIPERALINEMAWDMLEDIRAMKKNEFKLFSLGTLTHRVAIQVSCIEPGSESEPGRYQYKIFNTGWGADKFHQLDDTQKYAYPLVFNQLSLQAFSYSFLEELLRLLLERDNIDAFYHLHDNALVDKAGGKKEKQEGMLYFLQKYGTCSYASVKAWIDSCLNESQRKRLEIVKTKISMRKQERVIQVLQNEASSANWRIKKGKRSIPHSLFVTKANKLRESVLLLKLGQTYLEKITKDHSLPEENRH